MSSEQVDEIVTSSGQISVRAPDGRFQAIKTPAGFTDIAFRNGVAAADLAYRTLGAIPTVDECYRFWPKITKQIYARLFATDEFKAALRYRGVEWVDGSGLTAEQNYTLLALLDPSDRRTTRAKLKELGVPFAKYEVWTKQPLFMETLAKRQGSLFSATIVPLAENALMGEIEARNMRAIEIGLAMSGRWNPAEKQVEDARAVVMKVLESVIRHVPDPDARKAIMADVALYAGTLQALEG